MKKTLLLLLLAALLAGCLARPQWATPTPKAQAEATVYPSSLPTAQASTAPTVIAEATASPQASTQPTPAYDAQKEFEDDGIDQAISVLDSLNSTEFEQ